MQTFFIKKHLKEVMVFVLLSVAALCFAEYATRFLVSLEPVTTDPILGLRPTAGAESDSRGFRNKEALATSTIVALGDSMTMGGNATREEAWPQVLGELQSVSVYNMGMSGYSVVQDSALFDQALALKPIVVVVGLHLGTNIQNAYDMVYGNEYWKTLRNPELLTKEDLVTAPDDRIVLSMGIEQGTFKYHFHQAGLWLRAHSLAYARFSDVTRSLRQRIGIANTLQDNEKNLTLLAHNHPDLLYETKDAGIETVLSPEQQFDSIDLSRSETREGWRITQELFTEMKVKTMRTRVRLVVLIIPTKEQVYVAHWQNHDGNIPQEFLRYANVSKLLIIEIRNFCAKKEMECIFPVEQMSAALKDGKRIYSNSREPHPLPLGYRVIAETLDEYLRK